MKALVVLTISMLFGCASLPPFCQSDFIGPRTTEQRVDCLEARMGNTEKVAWTALGVGAIGVATGAGAIVEATRAVNGVKQIAAGMQ